MKLKHLKKTRKTLVKFMQKARTYNLLETVAMHDADSCAFATVTADTWSPKKVEDYFHLTGSAGFRLTDALACSLTTLFGDSDEYFEDATSVTWEEWLAAANVVEAKLTLAISKLELKKMKAKHA